MTAKLSILNDPPKVLEGSQLLHQLIKWDDHQQSCAIDFTNNNHRQKYTYSQIQACVRALISRIENTLPGSLSPQSQHIIPILLPQSPGLYISQLAILESGGAFCPINLDAPQERIKFVVGDVSANIIITTSDFRDAVLESGGEELSVLACSQSSISDVNVSAWRTETVLTLNPDERNREATRIDERESSPAAASLSLLWKRPRISFSIPLTVRSVSLLSSLSFSSSSRAFW